MRRHNKAKRSATSSGFQQSSTRGTATNVFPTSSEHTSSLIRLNKFLANSGICSRRQADKLIEEGVVKVNGAVVQEHGLRVHLSDLVTVRGEPVNAEKHLTYILLNKPKGYITTTHDEKGRKTVMDLLPPLRSRVYPVGRLDRNTTGALLLTNDGEMAHRLMHPRYGISRVYIAQLDKRLAQADAQRIARGIDIINEQGEHYTTGECNIMIHPNKPHSVILELAEGKNREVRRIFEHLGYTVEKLERRAYAGISIQGLARGEYRHLTVQEVRALEKLVGLATRYDHSTTPQQNRTNLRHTPPVSYTATHSPPHRHTR